MTLHRWPAHRYDPFQFLAPQLEGGLAPNIISLGGQPRVQPRSQGGAEGGKPRAAASRKAVRAQEHSGVAAKLQREGGRDVGDAL